MMMSSASFRYCDQPSQPFSHGGRPFRIALVAAVVVEGKTVLVLASRLRFKKLSAASFLLIRLAPMPSTNKTKTFSGLCLSKMSLSEGSGL